MPERYTVLKNDFLANFAKLKIEPLEMLFLIQLQSFLQQGEEFPSMEVLGERMKLTRPQLFQLVNGLIVKDLLAIEQITDVNGKLGECYSLKGLETRLKVIASEESRKKESQPQEKLSGGSLQRTCQLLEQEYSRALSPVEYEMVGQWFGEHQYDESMVIDAIRESLARGVMNIRYIDKILLNKERENSRQAMMDQEKEVGTQITIPLIDIFNND